MATTDAELGSADHTADAAPAVIRWRWRRTVAYFIGLALLGGAIVIVWRQRESLSPAFDSLRDAPLWLIALIPLLVIANLVFTGLHLQLLLSRFGRVPTIEMQMIIAATSLANYLPLRPGLVGRLVYHKQVHGIRLRDAARTQIESLIVGLLVIAVMLPVMLLADWLNGGALALLLAPMVITALAAIPAGPYRVWLAVFALKYADILAWAGRYLIAFELVGQSIGIIPAVALATIAMLASTMPFVSNGLGLRELLIGFLTPIITAWGAGAVLEGGSTLAIAADLANRALEILTVLATGLIGFAWLAHRHRSLSISSRVDPSVVESAE